jgi:hypothetical protein
LYYLQASVSVGSTIEGHGDQQFDPLHLNSYQLGGPECYWSRFDLYGRYLLMLSLPILVLLSLLCVWMVGWIPIAIRRKIRNVRVRNSLLINEASMMTDDELSVSDRSLLAANLYVLAESISCCHRVQ